MADIPVWYLSGKEFAAENDLRSVSIWCLIASDSYAPSYITHTLWTDVKNYSIVGETGVELTNKTVTQDATNNEAVLKCSNIVFGTGSANGVGKYIVFYVNDGAAGVLLCCLEIENPITYSAATLQIIPNAEGLFVLN